MPDRSVLSSPITLAAAIAGRTRCIRIGFAVYVLPLNHPIRIAEEIATLDHVSGGRVDLGIGRSGFTWFYEGYAVPYSESQGRFDEAVEVLRRAWTGKRFSFEGEHYRVGDALLCPVPRQRPHPPLRMGRDPGGGRSRGSGRPGFPSSSAFAATAWTCSPRSSRPTARRGATPATPVIRAPFSACPCTRRRPEMERARRRATPSSTTSSARASSSRATRPAAATRPTPPATRRPPASPRSTTATSSRNRAIVGSAAEIAARVEELRGILGIDGVVAELNPGGLLDEPTTLESLRILAREVKPRFGGQEDPAQ